jgi:chemotaxis methyl-accepting protein methylase
MPSPEDLNATIEQVTGIEDVLCLGSRRGGPYFGFDPSREGDRLKLLLEQEGVDIERLRLQDAINFLMPSTTDFFRPWIGSEIAKLVQAPDPRIVTLGCSTGLEVYSIAHFLRERNLLSLKGKIRGVDVNQKAVDIAKCGVYKLEDRYYFDRLKPNNLWGACHESVIFDEGTQTIRFSEEIKSHVDFAQANLLDQKSLRSLGLVNMDIVVIMNVLKYMTPWAQQEVLTNVNAIMREDGILYIDKYTRDLVVKHTYFTPVEGSEEAFTCTK